MRTESFDFLKRLVETPSPSGFERHAQAVWAEYVRDLSDEIQTDVYGNVAAVYNPEGRPRVMLAGHCDEIGLMVKYINDQGFIFVSRIGGVDPSTLVAKRVRIHGKDSSILGVIGRKAIHLMDAEDRKKVPKLHELWVDIGASSREEAEKLVAIGDPITIDLGFEAMRNDIVVARGLDDKMGAFVVAEALRLAREENPSAAIFAVSTTQEEIGLKGASVSAFGISPDAALAVDVGHAIDYPNVSHERYGKTTLGGGPMISRGAAINPLLYERLVQVAAEREIAVQIVAEPASTHTDADAINISRAGVATGLVSVPNRYMHTAVEMVHLGDLEAAARLIAGFITSLEEDVDFRLSL